MDKSYSVDRDSLQKLQIRRVGSPGASRLLKGKLNKVKIIEEALEREYASSSLSRLQLPGLPGPSAPAFTPASRLRVEVSQHTVEPTESEGENASGPSAEPLSSEDAALADDSGTIKAPVIVFAEPVARRASDEVLRMTEKITIVERRREEDETLRIPGPLEVEERYREIERAGAGSQFPKIIKDTGGPWPVIKVQEPLEQQLEGAASTRRGLNLQPRVSPRRRVANKLTAKLTAAREARARARRKKETKSADELLAEARDFIEAASLSQSGSTGADTTWTYTDILLSRSKVLDLPEKLTGDVLRGLVYPLTTVHNRQRLVVNLAQLQQLNLQQLRAELAREVSALVGSGSMKTRDSNRIREWMANYCMHPFAR